MSLNSTKNYHERGSITRKLFSLRPEVMTRSKFQVGGIVEIQRLISTSADEKGEKTPKSRLNRNHNERLVRFDGDCSASTQSAVVSLASIRPSLIYPDRTVREATARSALINSSSALARTGGIRLLWASKLGNLIYKDRCQQMYGRTTTCHDITCHIINWLTVSWICPCNSGLSIRKKQLHDPDDTR